MFSPTMLITSRSAAPNVRRSHIVPGEMTFAVRWELREKIMFGYSLLRLGLFVALAIVACTLVGLFTYLVVAALAE